MVAAHAGAQQRPAGVDPGTIDTRARDEQVPLGDWTGTSLCLKGKPTCKDERVVYHVVPRAAAKDSTSVPLTVTMSKVVNGVEEEMAVLACTYVAFGGQLVCPMPPQWQKGAWRLDRKGDRMTGGLWLDEGGQWREVDVHQATPRVPAPKGGR